MTPDRLIAKQQEQRLTDTEFAALIDVARTTWSSVKRGHTRLSGRVQRGAWLAFPDLRHDFFRPDEVDEAATG